MPQAAEVSKIIHDVSERLGDSGKVETVFGEPREVMGRVIVPAAKVSGGGGAGAGMGPSKEVGDQQEGGGAGMGMEVRPMGWLVVTETSVTWQPVIDVNRIITLGAIVSLASILALRAMFKSRKRHRA